MSLSPTSSRGGGGGTPSGPAGGDLSGTYPDPTVGNVSILTTKGDLLVDTSNGVAGRLGVGAVGQSLGVVSGLPAWQNNNGLRASLVINGMGLKGEVYPYNASRGANGLTAGVLYAMATGLLAGDVVTNVCIAQTAYTSGATLFKAAIYDSTGTRVAVSADFSASLATGAQAYSVPVSYTVPTSGLYYLAVVNVGGIGLNVGGGGTSNVNLGFGAGVPVLANVAGQTDAPTSFAFPAAAGQTAIWLGWS